METNRLDSALEQLLITYNELNPARVEETITIPTPLQFMRYVAQNRPFVIRGGCRSWTAYKRWTASYLLSVLGESHIDVAVTPDGLADSPHQTPSGLVFVEPLTLVEPFSRALESIVSRKPTDPVKYCQTQNDNLRGEYAALLDDVPDTIDWACEALEKEPDAVNFWLGDESSVTSLHKDNYENVYAQIRGRKLFTLLPPIVAPAMKEAALPLAKWELHDREWTVVVQKPVNLVPVPTWDPLKPEEISGLPEHVKPMTVVLEEGDMMYLPAMWYHHVRQQAGDEGFSCSVNYWYDMDFAGQFWATNNFIRQVALQSATAEKGHEERVIT